MEELINILVNESVRPQDFDKRVKSLSTEFNYQYGIIQETTFYIEIDGIKHQVQYNVMKIELKDLKDIYCL